MGLINFVDDNVINIDNSCLHLTKAYREQNTYRFKKITGSRFCAVVNQNKYTSEFRAWLEIVNLYKSEMDETLALAGNIIEPKIRDYVSNITNNEYISYDPKTIRFDCFRDNKIFGGIPDGEPKHGYLTNNDCMLEIKTTSIDKIKYCIDDNLNFKMIKNSSGVPEVSIPNQKKNEWYDENGGLLIPYEYQLQLGLYLFLRNVEYGLFAIGFLSPIDYVYPHQFDPIVKAKDNNLVLQKISIHDISDLHKHIDYAQKWYQDHVLKGVSPKMTINDKQWLLAQIQLLNKK